MITVEKTNPRDPQASALLAQSHALMQSLFPPEDNFYLDVTALCAPHIHFFAAREGETILGTGALAVKKGYGEVKSMFVAESARGRGVADTILTRLITEARAQDLSMLKLETGNVLHAAHRLYARHGFTVCERFGDYNDAKSSIFMERKL